MEEMCDRWIELYADWVAVSWWVGRPRCCVCRRRQRSKNGETVHFGKWDPHGDACGCRGIDGLPHRRRNGSVSGNPWKELPVMDENGALNLAAAKPSACWPCCSVCCCCSTCHCGRSCEELVNHVEVVVHLGEGHGHWLMWLYCHLLGVQARTDGVPLLWPKNL